MLKTQEEADQNIMERANVNDPVAYRSAAMKSTKKKSRITNVDTVVFISVFTRVIARPN